MTMHYSTMDDDNADYACCVDLLESIDVGVARGVLLGHAYYTALGDLGRRDRHRAIKE